VGRSEINGFDETGTIGNNLKFVRVGMDESLLLRPFVYNILHFGSITVTKTMLRGVSDDVKRDYVRKAMADQSIDIAQYLFTPDHQLDVLRKFTMLEGKSLFSLRAELIGSFESKDFEQPMSKISNYLKRYEKSPFWMESYVKAYGFRMIVADLCKTSRVLKAFKREDVKIFTQVDGGFPFVFWKHSFLDNESNNNIGFCTERTKICGITKGDEYYPAVSMAGNIAYISNNVNGMTYPHSIRDVPKMDDDEVNIFYEEFQKKACKPVYNNRILFIGKIPTDIQYSIPFILHHYNSYKTVYEPYRLEYHPGRSYKSFISSFGRHPRETIISGIIDNDQDREIVEEIESYGKLVKPITEYVDNYEKFQDEIILEAESSNLRTDQISKVKKKIERSKKEFNNFNERFVSQ
jgi:hypothetical protein